MPRIIADDIKYECESGTCFPAFQSEICLPNEPFLIDNDEFATTRACDLEPSACLNLYSEVRFVQCFVFVLFSSDSWICA